MNRIVYEGIGGSKSQSLQVFWLAGMHRSAQNEWWIRTVLRTQGSGLLHERYLPIGMLPILSLGVWFDQDVLRVDDVFGEEAEAVIHDVSTFDVLTSDGVSPMLYPLPEGKTGTQRLFRYRTTSGDVIIPAIELIRSLFLHNRALALALMRPAGIEQLYYPERPGQRDRASLQFTQEMPARALGERMAMEFAWIALDPAVRRSWDSVLRHSHDRPYVMFDPPSIKESTWSFRGVRHDDQWFVLELYAISGRRLPCNELEYSHPSFERVVRVATAGEMGGGRPGRGCRRLDTHRSDGEWTLRDEHMGSGSYRRAKIADVGAKWTAFENQVTVRKLARTVIRPAASTRPSTGMNKPLEGASAPSRCAKVTAVAAGERTDQSALPPLDFKILKALPSSWMGDLAALDEATHHISELLPTVSIRMSLVPLKPGRTVSLLGARMRPAMVVAIVSEGVPSMVLLDIERSGISALSLMALQFHTAPSSSEIEAAVKCMLDGFVDAGGYWSTGSEVALRKWCRCIRIPKLLVPRHRRKEFGKYWARRLILKLGLK